jgi:hypothetical protein
MTIRSNTARTALVALLAAGLATLLIVLLFPSQATTAPAQSPGSIVRLVSAYDMDGEVSTDDEAGIMIFNRNVVPPSNANTLYVTFSGTGDSHGGSTTRLGCRVDGHGCPNDDKFWTDVQKFSFDCEEFDLTAQQLACTEGDGGGGPGDWHDNNINLQWCQTIKPGSRHKNVQVWLSADPGEGEGINDFVFVEDVTFYVDAQSTPHGCQEFDMNSVGGTATKGGEHG